MVELTARWRGRVAALLALLVMVVMAAGCGDEAAEEPAGENLGGDTHTVSVYPAAIRFASADGLSNRHAYEITGPTWDDPHVEVGDEVWRVGDAALVTGAVLQGRGMNEPAPYTRTTPMRIGGDFVWTGEEGAVEPTALAVRAEGLLLSTTDLESVYTVLDAEAVVDVASAESAGEGVEVAFEPVDLTSDVLPSRVDVYELIVEWTMTPIFPGEEEGESTVVRTVHVIPTSMRDPIESAPLYRESVLWAAAWGAGEWDDTHGPDDPATLELEHAMSLAQLHGSRTLEDIGYSYGAFPRPPRDQIDDRINVFLDFKRSACGEFRGLLMGLIEFHGIDAYWIWFRFPPDADITYTHYMTRPIAAVGREEIPWVDTNHIIVGVNGQVYDPTYTVHKPSWQAYEDWMFEKYCIGRPSDLNEDAVCIPNPAGFDPEWDMQRIEADNYR